MCALERWTKTVAKPHNAAPVHCTSQGVTVRSLPVSPAPLTPSYLSDVAFPEINREQSEAIYKALK